MISVVELLQSLVRIPSVNPDGNPGVSPHGEKKVALAIQDFLAPFGFDIVLEDVEPDRPNLVARAPGPENRPRIMLAPHLDTVGIDGMTIDPFAASVSEGKIHGRGTSDTKGSMAAMLWGWPGTRTAWTPCRSRSTLSPLWARSLRNPAPATFPPSTPMNTTLRLPVNPPH